MRNLVWFLGVVCKFCCLWEGGVLRNFCAKSWLNNELLGEPAMQRPPSSTTFLGRLSGRRWEFSRSLCLPLPFFFSFFSFFFLLPSSSVFFFSVFPSMREWGPCGGFLCALSVGELRFSSQGLSKLVWRPWEALEHWWSPEARVGSPAQWREWLWVSFDVHTPSRASNYVENDANV